MMHSSVLVASIFFASLGLMQSTSCLADSGADGFETPEQLEQLKLQYKEISQAWRAHEVHYQETLGQKSFLDRFEDSSESEYAKYFATFDQLSAKRALLLKKIRQSGLFIISQTPEYFNDVLLEVKLVPRRLAGLAFKRVRAFRAHLGSGAAGWFALLKEVLLLVGVFLIPIFAIFLFKKFSRRIEEWRMELLKKRDSTNYKIAGWIQALNPYFPWLTFLIVVRLVRRSLDNTMTQDISVVLPLVEYYIFYRVFLLLARGLVERIRKQGRVRIEGFSEKADKTIRQIGLFFFIAFSVLYISEYSADQGIVYGIVKSVIQVFGLIVCCLAAAKWRDFIVSVGEKSLADVIQPYTVAICRRKFLGLFWCFPTLIVLGVASVLRSIWRMLSRWEVSKRFIARLYRKKIESTGQNKLPLIEQEVPEDYQKLFTTLEGSEKPYELMVPANASAYKRVREELDGWIEGTEEEHSIAIIGEKGIGKSTFLDRIEEQYGEVDVVRMSVPAKTTSPEALRDFLKEALGIEKESSLARSLVDISKNGTKKKLILVDEAHNLFLSKIGGFSGLQEFINLVNLKTENIFWVSVFNEYAWAYIRGVYGKAQYFRTEVYLKNWNDDEIGELIRNRHGRSPYQLSFEKILGMSAESMDEEEEAQAENQFYRLLWEQADGNPRVALQLWKKCLSLKGALSQNLVVGLPERKSSEKVRSLTDDSWFVLASIARHDNLSRQEIADVTSLTVPVVSHALKICLESEIVYKAKGRYQFDFNYQLDLVRQLRMKNYIYGLT